MRPNSESGFESPFFNSPTPHPDPYNPNPSGHNSGKNYEEWAEQSLWLLECANALWSGFCDKFLALWDSQGQHPLKERQKAFLDTLLWDTVSFAGN